MTRYIKYPRTPHLPWSPGIAPDDEVSGRLSGLEGREVVVTEKLDGENTTLYADHVHARSVDSAHHPSRSWVKTSTVYRVPPIGDPRVRTRVAVLHSTLRCVRTWTSGALVSISG
jgi:hypothetical protein